MFDYNQGNFERFSPARSRITGGSSSGLSYPSPFFDVAQTYLPDTIRRLFRWCRYFYLTNPTVSAVISKMAEYPLTDIVVEHKTKEVTELWEEFLEDTLQIRKFFLDLGLYYYAYGNSMISIQYPFVKYLKCGSCGQWTAIKDSTYRFQHHKFVLNPCPECGVSGEAEVRDVQIKSPRDIKLIIWNPEDITVVHNDITGEDSYFFRVPRSVKNDIMLGKPHVIEVMPQIVLDAVRKQKQLRLYKTNFCHLRRPSMLTGTKDAGMGIPMLLPVLKDAFLLQVLKKSNEAVALERIYPLSIIYPAAGSAQADPYCVTHDTLIETRKGIKPAGEVDQGDFVRTHKGRWEKVEAAVDRPVEVGEPVFKVTAASLTAFPFTLSAGHPLLAVKRVPGEWRGYDSLGEPSWVEAKDVAEKDYVCYPTHRPTWTALQLDLAEYNPERAATKSWVYRRINQQSAEIYEYFEQEGLPDFSRVGLSRQASPRMDFLADRGWSIEEFNNARAAFVQQGQIERTPRYLPVTSDLAFVIGLYAAQGSTKGALAALALDIDKPHLRQRLDQALAGLAHKPSGTFAHGPGCIEYVVNDVILSSVLFACGRGAQRKRLPRFIMEAPGPIALSALEGLLLGDGCDFSTATRRIGLKTVSPQLAMDARTILLSHEVLPTTQCTIPREDEIAKLPYYQVNVNGTQADYLAHLLGRGPEAPPGHSRCGFFRDGYVYLRVRSKVAIEGVDVVRGFQVRGDKSFCVAGVATHNSSIDLRKWRDHVQAEINRWRKDRAYVPIMPLPLGHQVIGGDGRALLTFQEMQMLNDHIIAGMHVPREFITGGLSFSGSNVSMRMLENHFIRYVSDMTHVLRHFIVKNVATYLEWPEPRVRFKPFKMADDLQRKALLFQYNQAQKVSDSTLLLDADLSPEKEDELMMAEAARRMETLKKNQLAQAEVQGEAQVVMSKYQARSQAVMQREQMQAQQGMTDAAPGEALEGVQQGGVPGQPAAEPPPQQPLPEIAQQMAQQMAQMPPEHQQVALQQIAQQSPQLADMVVELLTRGGNQQGPRSAGAPLPEGRAPRRGPEAAAI
jgi:hypothetical protein